MQFWASSAALALAFTAYSQGLPAGVQRVTSVEGVTEYRLANGLEVLLFPDNSRPTVSLNVAYFAGSRHENYGEAGIAHLLEHLMFKGTVARRELVLELRNHASNFNASTQRDYTCFYETMSATDENLRWALEMEADRMVNSRISREDLNSEMPVVRNEFQNGENNSTGVLRQRVLETAYELHAYGRSPIGARSDIENAPIERLQAFYHNYYQPDNALVAVTGQFDTDKALGWIQGTFGALPKPARKLIATYTEEPVQDGEREVVLRRAGDTQALIAAYHIPAPAHPDFAAVAVLVSVLGDNPSGRLYKSLVESKLAVAVNVNASQWRDPGLLVVAVNMRKEQPAGDVQKAMLETIAGVGTSVAARTPSKEEVERARAHVLKNLELPLNNSSQMGLILMDAAGAGDWRLPFAERDDVRNVTVDDVTRVAKQYLKPSNSTLGRFIPTDAPDRSEIPRSPDLAARLKDYKGNRAAEEGEAFDPAPANVEARVTRATLPSGLKVVLLPKKNRGGTVIANLSLHFGEEKSLFGKAPAGRLTGALLMRGTQQHTAQQLQDELNRLKIRMNADGPAMGANANIETVRENLPAALRLAAEIFREPAFPESELDQIRDNLMARLENSRREPAAIASLALTRHVAAAYGSGDPRAVETLDGQLRELRRVAIADVRKFYADFYGASDGELVVVGDFDPAETQKLAGELFGAWKSPAPYAQVKRTWRKLDAVDQAFETPDKANGMLLGVVTLNMDNDDADFLALTLANNIFGGGSGSRLFQRIRGKEGLSYGVGTSFMAGDQEKFGQFIFQAIATPQNMRKVEAAFKEELARALGEGFTAGEVEAAKRQFVQDNAVQMSQDAFLAIMVGRYAQFGRPLARLTETLQRVQAMTADEVNAAFRRWIDPAAISYFKAGDFKKAEVVP